MAEFEIFAHLVTASDFEEAVANREMPDITDSFTVGGRSVVTVEDDDGLFSGEDLDAFVTVEGQAQAAIANVRFFRVSSIQENPGGPGSTRLFFDVAALELVGNSTDVLLIPIDADNSVIVEGPLPGGDNYLVEADDIMPAEPVAYAGTAETIVTIDVDSAFLTFTEDNEFPEFLGDRENDPPTKIVFQVTRTGDLQGESTVEYTITSDEATADDFVGGFPMGGTLTFAPDQDVATITVPVVNDLIVEPDETFTVTLTSATGASIGDQSSADAIIFNDDLQLSIEAVNPTAQAEGSDVDGITRYAFEITRFGNQENLVRFGLIIAGTGANPADASDFVNSELVIPVRIDPGDPSLTETVTTVFVDVVHDSEVEGDEEFTVSLPAANMIRVDLDEDSEELLPFGVTIGSPASAGGTILNDDGVVTVPGLSVEKVIDGVDLDGDETINAAGEVIAYRIITRNTGTAALTGVTVTDELTGEEFVIGDLAVGADPNEQLVTYVVTQADINSGIDIVNTATADSDQTEPVMDDAPGVPVVQNSVLSIDKEVVAVDAAGNGKIDAAGEVIDYRITATNDGNTTLTDVEVVDTLIGGPFMLGDLAPGESAVVTVALGVSQLVINAGEDIVNTAIGTSNEDDAEEVSTDPIPVVQNIELVFTKEGFVQDGGDNDLIDEPGERIGYNLTLTNTGNVTLTNVFVSDPLLGDDIQFANLAPGQTAGFLASYAITQDDIDNNGGGDGTIDNTATAFTDQTDPVMSSDSVPITQTPVLAITKLVDKIDSDGNGKIDAAGEQIDYRILVGNDGNTTLTNITVTDELTGETFLIGTLAPGEGFNQGVSYTVTQADIDAGIDIVNTATGTSDQDDADDTTADPVSVDRNPLLSLEKSLVNVDPNGDGIINAAFEQINYTITASNDGNTTLTDVEITDGLTGETFMLGDLAPGESVDQTVTYTVTPDDIAAGVDIVNTATGTSNEDDAEEVSADPVEVQQFADLTLEKGLIGVNGSVTELIDNAGDVLTFEIIARNTGNVTLTNVILEDELTGLNKNIGDLAPGEFHVELTDYVITQDDFDTAFAAEDEVFVNIAVGGSDQTGPDSDVEPDGSDLTFDPVLALEKVVTGVDPDGNRTIDQAGDEINYKITASNDGNITLTDVTVTDDLTGETFMLGDLAPGASAEQDVTYTVTQADIDAGSDIVNTATGISDQDDADPVSAEPVDVLELPGLELVKRVAGVDSANDGVINEAGDEIEYDLVVTNRGNQTLTNVTVTDDLTGDVIDFGTILPGEEAQDVVVYEVTQEDIDTNGGGDGDIDNTAVAVSDQAGPVSSTTAVAINQPPFIILEKRAASIDSFGNGVIDNAGETILYDISITNLSNETLTGVIVNDSLLGEDIFANFTSDRTIEPNGRLSVSGLLYSVTQEDIDTNGGGDGDIDNVVTLVTDQFDPFSVNVEVPIITSNDPALSVEKTIIGIDTDPGGNGIIDRIGEIITSKITVTNTGNVLLTNVEVFDDLTGDLFEVGDLEPGAVFETTVDYAVTKDDFDSQSVVIDFSTDGDGNVLAAGTIIDDEFQPLGVTVTGGAADNPLMIFDSSNPTGSDDDLGTESQGNILIISENGDSSNPDDNKNGGVISFDFEGIVDIEEITLLDREEKGTATSFDGSNVVIDQTALAMTGDGGVVTQDLDVENVGKLNVEIKGSGAVDDLTYTDYGGGTLVNKVTVTSDQVDGNAQAMVDLGDLVGDVNDVDPFTYLLIDPVPDTNLGEIEDGAAIDTSTLTDDAFNIAVDVNDALDVESVEFSFEGETVRTENIDPFALAGDDPMTDNFFEEELPDGPYELTVSAFDEDEGMGILIAEETLEFTITS